MSKLKINGSNWKDIKGYEGLYKISNDGKIYSYKSKRLIKYTKSRGGYCVKLCKNNEHKKLSVARLIAIHFVYNPYNYKYIYFVDGNNTNLNYYNIQWGSCSKNTKIVIDGMIFDSITKYKEYCKINKQVQYLMELGNECDFDFAISKTKNNGKLIF